MFISPNKVSLVVGNGKNGPRLLQKAIWDGDCFDWDQVNVEQLGGTVRHSSNNKPPLIFLKFGGSAAKLREDSSGAEDNCCGPFIASPDYPALLQLTDDSELYCRSFVLRGPPQILEEGKCKIATT